LTARIARGPGFRLFATLSAPDPAPTVDAVSRIGLTVDELAAHAAAGGPGARYVAHLDGLDLLAGELVAFVGPGAAPLRASLCHELPCCRPIDGARAARTGTLRVEAVQARRAGIQSLVVSDPLAGAPDEEAAALALADLAGLEDLGLTVAVDFADPYAAALVGDRVAVVGQTGLDRAYPVLAPRPRSLHDVRKVTERALARLAAA
jgi:hypothetical protein